MNVHRNESPPTLFPMAIIKCFMLALVAQAGNAEPEPESSGAWHSTINELGSPTGAAFLPDGRMLVTEQHDHAVSIINRKQTPVVPGSTGHPAPATWDRCQ